MGIATQNLPSFSAADEVLVNQTVNGLKRVGRLPLGSLADQLMGIEPLSGVAEVVEVVDQLAAPRNSVEGGYAPKIAA